MFSDLFNKFNNKYHYKKIYLEANFIKHRTDDLSYLRQTVSFFPVPLSSMKMPKFNLYYPFKTKNTLILFFFFLIKFLRQQSC